MIQLDFLANHPQFIPTLADWYFKEWGYLTKDNSLEKVTAKLQEYLNTDKIPLILLAIEAGEMVGAVQLKYHEMTIYPEKEHWLGGVYVRPDYRGQRIAEKMIHSILSIAAKLGVDTLHLQTQRLDGGLYQGLGWKPIEQIIYRGIRVLVMEKKIR